ncbi:MAG: DUF3592 domain-containing protein [Hyphomicrobiaceae bacterium]
MMKKLLSVPGMGAWTWLALSLIALTVYAFAQSRVGELARHGVDETATVTRAYVYRTTASRTHSAHEEFRIDYVFALADGRRISGWKALDRDVWEKAKPGQTLKVRYSLKNPSVHTTAADEYGEAAQWSYILGWISLFLAGFFLLHDVRKAVPWLAPRLRKVSTGLLAVALLSVASALVLRAHVASDGDFALTDGEITAKQVVGSRPDAVTQGLEHRISYTFVDETGRTHAFTRAVDKDDYESADVGQRLPVRYLRGDPRLHELTSAELLDFALVSLVLALFLALLAVPFVVLDLRAYRRGPGQPA